MLHRLRSLCVLGVLVVGLSACANHAPPTLSPQAAAAWYGTRIIQNLDLLRDVVQDANKQVPPLVSVETARKVTLYHQSAITIVHDAPNGWKAGVQSGLSELQHNLPSNESRLIGPYVALLQTVLQEVH